MEPSGADDPNCDALNAIIADLKVATDVTGRKLDVRTIPSPGLVPDDKGEPFLFFRVHSLTSVLDAL